MLEHPLRGIALLPFLIFLSAAFAEGNVEIRQMAGQAELGTVEIHGVKAGEFRPALWESGKLNLLPDVRSPLIEPRKRGVFRNIYAPSAVRLDDGWRVFYGAWDGVDSQNDRIYSLNTRDFLDFSDRQTIIEHGEFIHVCNVSAVRLPTGGYSLMCTACPDEGGLNKPAAFYSPDGLKWNGSPAPYPARKDDIISIDGYDKFRDADMNGMNVILYEDGAYRLYFGNFRDSGKVFRATSRDGKRFRFDGIALEPGNFVNDVKKLEADDGRTYYLMALHQNTDRLWYSISEDGMKFRPARELVRNMGEEDRYIVAVGWVTEDNKVLGFLYGAGAVPSLDRNRIWARWLQKKVVFVANDGTRYLPTAALGPDRQIIKVPKEGNIEGHFEVYAEDGTTPIGGRLPGSLVSGTVWTVTGM